MIFICIHQAVDRNIGLVLKIASRFCGSLFILSQTRESAHAPDGAVLSRCRRGRVWLSSCGGEVWRGDTSFKKRPLSKYIPCKIQLLACFLNRYSDCYRHSDHGVVAGTDETHHFCAVASATYIDCKSNYLHRYRFREAYNENWLRI